MQHLFSRSSGCYVLILLLAGIYLVGSIPFAAEEFVTIRENLPAENPLASDKYRFGDLYGISFLPEFRLPYLHHTTRIGTDSTDLTRPYNLYVMGDSYTKFALLRPSAFAHATSLTIGAVDDVAWGKIPAPVKKGKSILVLETSERYLRRRFGVDRYPTTQMPAPTVSYNASWLLHHIYRFVTTYCRDMSADLEYFLFDYGLLRPLKETRAYLTYTWFGRTSEGVKLSADKHRLYLKETINGQETSSFARLDSVDVTNIVFELNRIGQRASQRGYSAVFISIIPNPISVIEPNLGRYNHLVERVEHHPALKIGVISMYDRFRINGARYYHPSDSHWNQTGIDMWVTTMNRTFNHIYRSNAF